MRHFSYLIILASALLVACGTTRVNTPTVTSKEPLTAYELHLVDSILQYGLENEALFTLMGRVKPMSSLVLFSFPVANTDSAKRITGDVLNRKDHGKYLDRMRTIQQAMNKIDLPDLDFVVVPYLNAQGNRRIIQLSVVRKSSLDSLLNVKENFYGQFGLVPGSNPYSVMNAVEGNDSFSRWRGYGYMFGYPDYAVDFYNEASREQVENDNFVPRNFFRIPSYSREEGNFVYAYPKDHVLNEVDSALYKKSVKVLDAYRSIRPKYLKPDGTVQAYKLLQDYYKK